MSFLNIYLKLLFMFTNKTLNVCHHVLWYDAITLNRKLQLNKSINLNKVTDQIKCMKATQFDRLFYSVTTYVIHDNSVRAEIRFFCNCSHINVIYGTVTAGSASLCVRQAGGPTETSFFNSLTEVCTVNYISQWLGSLQSARFNTNVKNKKKPQFSFLCSIV